MTAAPSSLVVPALVRAVTHAGGFATVLLKGHEMGSALLVVHRRAGQPPKAWERVPAAVGPPQWRQAAEGEAEVAAFLERQRRFDPDIWAIELDIGEPARFIEGFPPVS